MRPVFALFLAAHGLVHLIYVGQALGKYEVEPGFTWPDGAWALSWLSQDLVRSVAATLLGLVGVVFVGAGVALAVKLGWWQGLAVVAAAGSSIALLLLWNGRLELLHTQGLIALVLNAVVLAAVIGFRWPSVE